MGVAGHQSRQLAWTVLDPFSGGPFRSAETFTNRITNGVPLLQFPRPFTELGTVPTQSVTGVNVDAQVPYTHQWNLTVERQLPHAIVGRVSWRGHRVVQLLYSGDRNKPLPSTNSANASWFRYPQFFGVTFIENGGTQLGNLLETEIERKFAQGLTFQFGWTWAKVLSDVGGGDVSGGIEAPYDRRREKGDDPSITRHRAVAYGIYELPFGTGKQFGGSAPGWIRQAFGNWQTSSVLVLQSGRFLTPTFSGPDVTNTRTFGGRADWIGDWEVSDPDINRWFNPGAFAVPPVGRYGNSARSVMTGPGLVNYDLGIFKFFQVTEKSRLRAEMTATNFFNHPNFGNPNTNISSANVGRISGINGAGLGGGARRIKLGLRFDF